MYKSYVSEINTQFDNGEQDYIIVHPQNGKIIIEQGEDQILFDNYKAFEDFVKEVRKFKDHL